MVCAHRQEINAHLAVGIISFIIVRRMVPAPEVAPPARSPLRTRELLRGWEWTLAALVCSRLVILGVIALSRITFRPARYWQSGNLLSVLIQWDASLWYLDIARYGYTFSTVQPSRMPFFPLYPLLVKAVSFVFHDTRIAGLLVSNLSLIVAALLFNALINVDYDDPRVNRTAAIFFAFSPYSFFFSCAYTESTFLLLTIGSFLAARQRRWLLACLLGMCLSATRQVGVLIGLPLLMEYVWQHWRPGSSLKPLFHPRILLLGLVPMGLAAFMYFSYYEFRDPLAFAHAAAGGFKRYFASPVATLASVEIYPPFFDWLFIGVLVTSLVLLVIGVLLRVRASYLTFAAILTATYLCSSSLEALPRYLSAEFVLFVVLAVMSTRFKWTYEPLLVASIGLLTICTALFATGFWIT